MPHYYYYYYYKRLHRVCKRIHTREIDGLFSKNDSITLALVSADIGPSDVHYNQTAVLQDRIVTGQGKRTPIERPRDIALRCTARRTVQHYGRQWNYRRS